MARVGNSIFDITGKVGDLVYYRYKGKSMVRKASTGKRPSPTQLQLEHQAKFAAVANFLRPLNEFLGKTFIVHKKGKSGYQKAFSANFINAVIGTYPAYSLDYKNVCLGNGNLSDAVDLTVNSAEPGKLVFTWSEQIIWNGSLSSDQFYVAIYSEKLNDWFYQFDCAERYKRFCRVNISFFSGTRVQIYTGFLSTDKKRVSTPLYFGDLMVS